MSYDLPPTPCLQIAVIRLDLRREMDSCLSVSDRGVTFATSVNGTLMARARARPNGASSWLTGSGEQERCQGRIDSGPDLLLVIALVGGQQLDYLLADPVWVGA